VSAPDVAIPAATVRLPGATPAVSQSAGSGDAPGATWTTNIVVPYASIVSPGATTPAPSASAHASIVPAATGVPAGIPASSASSPSRIAVNGE